MVETSVAITKGSMGMASLKISVCEIILFIRLLKIKHFRLKALIGMMNVFDGYSAFIDDLNYRNDN